MFPEGGFGSETTSGTAAPMNRLSVEAADVNCSNRREVFDAIMAEATDRAAMTAGAMINLMADGGGHGGSGS
jgi:hypothetical protein